MIGFFVMCGLIVVIIPPLAIWRIRYVEQRTIATIEALQREAEAGLRWRWEV